MTDRDRLIELLHKAEDICDSTLDCDTCKYVLSGSCKTVLIAEHLIENGVIVPPVEVGQTVWYIKGGYYRKTGLEARPIKVTEINKKWHGKTLVWGFIANGTRYRFSSIGKTVFLTKEEAEEKLKELGK